MSALKKYGPDVIIRGYVNRPMTAMMMIIAWIQVGDEFTPSEHVEK